LKNNDQKSLDSWPYFRIITSFPAYSYFYKILMYSNALLIYESKLLRGTFSPYQTYTG